MEESIRLQRRLTSADWLKLYSSGTSQHKILFCRYCFGNRRAISCRCSSSMTIMRYAQISSFSDILLAQYNPADRVSNFSLKRSSAVLLRFLFWLHTNKIFIETANGFKI